MAMNSILDLPTEISVLIFRLLRPIDLERVERVCRTWSRVVVFLFWHRRLVRQSETDPSLAHALYSAGWSPSCDERFVVRQAYVRLMSSQRWTRKPKVRSHPDFMRYGVEDRTRRDVTSIVVSNCGEKIFLAMHSGVVESWRLDTLALDKILVDVSAEDSEAFWNGFSFRKHGRMHLYGNALVAPDARRRSVLLFNSDTCELEATLPLPEKNQRTTAVKVNRAHVVCLATRGALVVWQRDTSNISGLFNSVDPTCVPQVLTDFHGIMADKRHVSFLYHGVDMNDAFVVTYLSELLADSASQVTCRRLSSGDSENMEAERRILWPNASNSGNVTNIRLSAAYHNLLAILLSCRFELVIVMDVVSGNVVHNLITSPRSCFPIKWVGDALFVDVRTPAPYSRRRAAAADKINVAAWRDVSSESTPILVDRNVKLPKSLDPVHVDWTRIFILTRKRLRRQLPADEPGPYTVTAIVHDYMTQN